MNVGLGLASRRLLGTLESDGEPPTLGGFPEELNMLVLGLEECRDVFDEAKGECGSGSGSSRGCAVRVNAALPRPAGDRAAHWNCHLLTPSVELRMTVNVP